MSTTVSKPTERSLALGVIDEWITGRDCMFNTYPSYSDYEMVKLGRKEYGFRPRNKQLGGVVVSYRCSHLEAQCRFRLMLVTRRLME